MLLLLLCLVGSALSDTAAERQISVGSASVTLDFTGLSSDVSVSACNQATFSNQGGRIVTLTIPTTNFRETCTFSVVEGGHARTSFSLDLANGDFITVPRARFIAALTVHLEQYNPAEAGNTFCVSLRTDDLVSGQPDPHPQIFRFYCDTNGPAGSNRVPLVLLTGGVQPSTAAFTVPVLLTTQAVTVVAEERKAGAIVVFTHGHTALGLVTDTNCADGRCDSGRLVAVLEVPLYCDVATINAWPATDVAITWNSSPDEFPVSTNFRLYPDVPGGADRYYVVLAADNYRVTVSYPPSGGSTAGGAPHSKTVASNCFLGTCEALAITSVLTVDVPGLTASLQLRQGSPATDQWGPFAAQTGTARRFCVFNLVNTEVLATFATGQTLRQSNINCETVNQRCSAGVLTARLCPDFGCLTNPMIPGPDSVRFLVWSQSQGVVHDVTGTPAAVLQCVTVPALSDYGVEIIESAPGASCPTTFSCLSCAVQSAASCLPEIQACQGDAGCAACLQGGYFSLACLAQNNAALNALKQCQQRTCTSCASAQNPFSNGCVRYNIPATSCAYVADSGRQTQCALAQAPVYGNFGRVLSAFELFFLPAQNLAGSAPQPGVDVTLATPPIPGVSPAVPYRVARNQGGAPRCYCVLPSYTTVEIREGSATWGSAPVPCLRQLSPPQAYDCSICDFLTILTFDLTGLPRGASAILSAGPATSTSPQTAVAFRRVNWVGGIQNNIAALRAGAGTLPPKRYYVTVDDNGAQYTLNNVCDGKTCPFGPFTAVLCLDLRDPAGVTPGCGSLCSSTGTGLLTTSLRTASNVEFRTIPAQGCCNGCAANAGSFPTLRTLKAAAAARTVYATPCGKYAVLRGNYQVVLAERTVASPPRAVDCTGATCTLPSLINQVTVDTRCGSGAPGTPFNPTAKLDLTLLDSNGVQFRGPLTNVLRNCSIGPAFYSGPTCPDVGQTQLTLAVIQTNFQARLEMLPVDSSRTRYPETREHPVVTLPVTCSSSSGIVCPIPQSLFFSNYLVQSQRGLPNSNPGPAVAAIKFGLTQQNVVRILQPSQLVADGVNSWCVLADNVAGYAVNWEAYASDGPGRPFTSCRKINPNRIDTCTTGTSTLLIVPPDGARK